MAESKASPGPVAPTKKTYYASNLKSSLTALVILHHTATSYGGEGRIPYQSSFHGQGSSAALVGFNAINQSFFMGSFMYLSGHFSRRSLERKGRASFLKDRVYRLGLPTAAYTFIGAPFCFAVVQKCHGKAVLRPLLDYYRDMRGVRGPLWFTASLLTFDFTLAGLHWLREKWTSSYCPQSPIAKSDRVSTIGLFSSTAATSFAEFFLRTIYPIGTTLNPLKLNVGYALQYVACYSFGVYAPTLEYALPSASASAALALLSGATSVLFAREVATESTPYPNKLEGGWNMLAAYYALWGNVTGYFLGGTAVAIYSKHSIGNWKWINDYAFPAFVVHVPVLTVLGCGTDRWQASGVWKTAVVGGATIVTSWLVGCAGSELWSCLEKIWHRSDRQKE